MLLAWRGRSPVETLVEEACGVTLLVEQPEGLVQALSQFLRETDHSSVLAIENRWRSPGTFGERSFVALVRLTKRPELIALVSIELAAMHDVILTHDAAMRAQLCETANRVQARVDAARDAELAAAAPQ